MTLRLLAILLTIPLWACASQPDSGAGNASAPAAAPAAPPAPSTASSAPAEQSTGAKILGVIETPLRIAFLIPACVASAPLAAPGAIASAIIPFKDNSKGTGATLLANEVKDACGPPYVATPH